jgi:hypothetical protein
MMTGPGIFSFISASARPLLLLLGVSLAVTCVPCADAGGLPSKQRGYLQQFAEVIAHVVAADKEMWLQLQFVSRRLDQYYFANGHFPLTDDEKESFRQSLLKNIVANPYKPQRMDLASYERLPEESPLSLNFLSDGTMTPYVVRQLVDKPPASWKADPGTMFVITNGDNYYVLWATSADCLPMRDLEHSSNRLKLIAHYCQASPKKK